MLPTALRRGSQQRTPRGTPRACGLYRKDASGALVKRANPLPTAGPFHVCTPAVLEPIRPA
eukprot:1609029-Prymnesium_polylepis.2